MTFGKHEKGSLTVEAALILPMFMMGLLTLVSVLLMHLAGMRIQASLLSEAERLAVRMEDGESIAVSSVRDEIARSIPEDTLRFIENGSDGLDLSGSRLDDEYIILSLNCNLVPLTDFFGLIKVPLTRRCLAHAWTGYENGFFPDTEYVYVTEDSDVYHIDRECSHILLTVVETSPEEVGSLRNDNGGRYRPCEICHSSLSDERLYVTPEGDRYHKSISCSALKRTVRAIRKSETGNRRPCSRCGR